MSGVRLARASRGRTRDIRMKMLADASAAGEATSSEAGLEQPDETRDSTSRVE